MRVFRVVCPDGKVAEDDLRWVRQAVDRARWCDNNHDAAICWDNHRVQYADWVTLP
jgi:hypothetical protein